MRMPLASCLFQAAQALVQSDHLPRKSRNNGDKQLSKIYAQSLLTPSCYKPRLRPNGPPGLMCLPLIYALIADEFVNWLLHRLERPRTQESVDVPPRRILP